MDCLGGLGDALPPLPAALVAPCLNVTHGTDREFRHAFIEA
jgi:hypothetical protein